MKTPRYIAGQQTFLNTFPACCKDATCRSLIQCQMPSNSWFRCCCQADRKVLLSSYAGVAPKPSERGTGQLHNIPILSILHLGGGEGLRCAVPKMHQKVNRNFQKLLSSKELIYPVKIQPYTRTTRYVYVKILLLQLSFSS